MINKKNFLKIKNLVIKEKLIINLYIYNIIFYIKNFII